MHHERELMHHTLSDIIPSQMLGDMKIGGVARSCATGGLGFELRDSVCTREDASSHGGVSSSRAILGAIVGPAGWK